MSDKHSYRILLGSFIVASLFWLTNELNRTHVARFAVPLSIVNLDPDVAIASELPPTIDVSLEGAGWQLFFLGISNQLAFELPGRRLRSDRFFLTGKNAAEALKLPSDVKVIQVYPETLFVDVDRFSEKRVPVRLPSNTITFKQDYGITGPVILTPDSVTISGAERIIRSIGSWAIEPRSWLNLSQAVQEDVPVSDSLAGIVTVSVKSVRVTIPVQLVADVTYPGIPVTVTGVPDGKDVMLLNSTVSVGIRGGMDGHDTLQPGDFRALLDYQAIIHDTTGSIPPQIVLPKGLQLLKVDPARIRYIIRQK